MANPVPDSKLPAAIAFGLCAVGLVIGLIGGFTHGSYVGGIIAAMAGTHTVGGQVTDPKASLESSLTVFNMLGMWGMGIGVGFIVISFFIKGWSNGANNAGDHPGPALTDRGQEDQNVAQPLNP